MTGLQISWIVIGVLFGIAMVFTAKRCFATHSGFVAMIVASLLGIIQVWFSWVAVVIALFFFGYGIYKNQHKFMGVAHDSSN